MYWALVLEAAQAFLRTSSDRLGENVLAAFAHLERIEIRQDTKYSLIAGLVLGLGIMLLLQLVLPGERPRGAIGIEEQLRRLRERSLPTRIILITHGESEGNADKTLYRTKADNVSMPERVMHTHS